MNTKDFVLLYRHNDVYKLAFKKCPEGVDLQMALQQITAFQILEKKVPSWAECDDLVFPKHLSLEQCSSEVTAKYKAEIIKWFVGKDKFKMVDLTGGLGIDCYFNSLNASECQYVEMNTELCDIAKHNFSIIAPNINVNNCSAEDFIKKYLSHNSNNYSNYFDLIYLDPARRGDHGQKLVSIADCQPNVIDLADNLFKIADHVVVKLSPMLDINRAINELPYIKGIYVISVNNECKELLLFLRNDGYNSSALINAVNIDNKGNVSDILSGSIKDESSLIPIYAEDPLKYLYEPYSAYIKSGLYKSIAHKYQVKQLHVNSHIYTSDYLIDNFPGRKFKILQIVDFDKKSTKALFKSIRQANITTRNFPISSDELRKQYKIKDGGEFYIFATTIYNDNKVLIVCNKCS